MDWNGLKMASRLAAFILALAVCGLAIGYYASGAAASNSGLFIEEKTFGTNGLAVWQVRMARARGCDRVLAAFATDAEAREFYEWAKANMD